MDKYTSNYDNYKQYSNVGFRIISILALLLSGFMTATYLYSFADATFFHSVANLHSGQEPVSMDYYQQTVKYPIRDLIFGIVFLITFIWTVMSISAKSVKSLSLCFITTIILAIIVFIINEVLSFI